MVSLVESASGILSQSQRQTEISAFNLVNMATPGFRRRVAFSSVLSGATVDLRAGAAEDFSIDLTTGPLNPTGKPYDLAIASHGFFAVAGPAGTMLTRKGQFRRDETGRLVTLEGYPLQMQGGGDLVLGEGTVKVLDDGSVTQNGDLAGKIAVTDIIDPSQLKTADGDLFSTADANLRGVESPSVRQGVLEASNVTTGAEMVAIMAALRRAEAGQKIIGVYDDLIGRVLTTLGQTG